MEAILPSKKVLFVVLPVILLVGIVYFSTHAKDSEEKDAASDLKYVFSEYPDEDEDGLSDWEEELWKTDPKNPDTDMDGMLDGEEVYTNHHPKVAGPKDEITNLQKQLVYATASQRGIEVPQGNETDDYFSLTLPQALVLATSLNKGRDITYGELEEILPQILSDDLPTPNNLLTEDDLTILPSPSISDFENFKAKLSDTIEKYNTGSLAEMEVIVSALESEDYSVLKKLSTVNNDYNKLVGELLLIPVPQTLSDKYLGAINNLAAVHFAVGEMSIIQTDPLRALKGILLYRSESAKTYDIFFALGSDYKEKLAQLSFTNFLLPVEQ